MESIPISIIAKICEYTVKPVGRQLCYVCFIHSNFQKLKSQVEKLTDTKGSVEDKVFIARRNAEDIKPAVEKWLEKVDRLVRKSEKILAHEGRHGRLCSTNLVQRHKASRKASKMADEVLEMKNQGESFDMVSFKGRISLVESPLPKAPDFLDFGSRKSTVEQIMDALSDDNVHKIGVYGMGGVGKTMLVKEIVRKIEESKKSFDKVVTSTISQTPDFKRIQGQLADKIGLKFEQETIEGRATFLRRWLKAERSILVVLDDVWEYIDLETIGIPSVEDHKGICKILFTSRNKQLISNDMGANKIFEIKVLGEDESWNLFKAMAGEIVEATDLKPIAIQIMRECAGLPIAITTVAKALLNKPSDIWNDALDQLKSVDVGMANIGEMDKKVYLSLKLSYDYLGYEEVKLLFLLCSMFPEDFNIDVEKLHIYAMSMGFLRGVDTVVKGRRRIKKLVDDLISSSLLQQYSEYGNNYVKIHDMVRDVAILIASQNDHIRTLSYVKRSNEEWKEEKLSGNHTVVFLIIQELDSPDFSKLMLPKVQLFVLFGPSPSIYNRHVVSVVETFYKEMKELKGLVIERVKISLSPQALYSFANLRLLRLHDCELGSIDMIGELKKVEILDFSKSNIVEIPMTFSKLTQLKVLNLSFCDELEVIPPNILSKLTKLEELHLETFDSWEGEEWYEGRKNASLSELRYLPHLYALNLTIQDDEIMPKHLFLAGELNLENFHITIGCQRQKRHIDNKTNFFRIKMESERCLDDWIKTLLKRSEEVHLKGSICSKVLHDANEFLHLKYLYISDNLEFQHFIHEKNNPLRKCLPKLEYLYLEELENLKNIIHGYHRESLFSKLKSVVVTKCNKLEKLFFNCILDDILSLEEIAIHYCEKMEVMIVMENEEATNHIEFTHLKYLFLTYVPQLQKFCSKIEKFGQLSQDNSISNTVDIGESFFNEEVSLPNLEKLGIKCAENLTMIWCNNVHFPNSFSKLEEVEIASCNNLHKVLFPSNVMSILTCLKVLRINCCKLLEGIFEVQESSITDTSLIVLKNLRELKLYNLPNLEYVWSKNPCELLSFVNIKGLAIDECPRLRREYSVKILKQLERLTMDIKQLMEVIENQKSTDHNMVKSKQLETSSKVEVLLTGDGSELFPNLKELTLYGFVEDNSTHLPVEIVQILYQLEHFELEGAYIEEVFPSNILIPMKKQYYARSKNSVRSWFLSKLPKLRHLWSECSQKNAFPILQDLNVIRISECGGLSSLVSSSVSFTNLTVLKVDKCDRLTYLLNPLVATTLVQLEELTLRECKMMSSVIEGGSAEEDGNEETTNQIEFTHLKSLFLKDLPRLQKFYSKIETFGQLSRDNSENPETTTIHNRIGDSFFSEQESLPNLETLRIDGAENLRMIWSNNVLIPNSFSKLEEVEIYSCNNLQDVLFHPNIINMLTCLNTLRIKNCELLEGIFEVQEPISVTKTKTNAIVLPNNLIELELYNLPNLEYLWSKNPNFERLVTFESIRSLSIEKCSKLKGEYFLSIKTFKQLVRLKMGIRQLTVALGKEVKSADHSMLLEPKQLETSSSKVEVLQLRDGSKLFSNLKELKLYGFVEYNSTHLPMEIVQVLNQLEKFELKGMFIEEIFPSNILIPSYMVLRELTLSKLSKLRHLWGECSQKNNDSLLRDLTFLFISKCGGLSSLVSSSVSSFTNLRILEVEKCDGLSHLLSSSVATTLVQLEELRIEECKRMSSVIEGGSSEEDGNDEIINDDDDDTWHHPKESIEMVVETDMNVIIREYWDDNIDTRISNLFGEENLEESQFEHSSSSNKVEE
uniref:Uncharacterized protein n=1 Tax=Cucumis sativus TaxID=3659 RepID=A0A0A0LLJ0_CUCSA